MVNMAENMADQSCLDDGLPPRGVPDIVRFAELYPAVPLRTLVIEVLHAQHAVAVGADDRDQIVAGLVAARLRAYSEQVHGDDVTR